MLERKNKSIILILFVALFFSMISIIAIIKDVSMGYSYNGLNSEACLAQGDILPSPFKLSNSEIENRTNDKMICIAKRNR